MKKIFLLTLSLFIILRQGFSQTNNCETLKKENEYLKKALLLQQDSGLSTFNTADHFRIKLISVIGSTKDRTITLNCIATNLGSRKDLNGFYVRCTGGNDCSDKLYDINGNVYNNMKISIGKKSEFSPTLDPNVPIKCWFTFYDITDNIPYIRKAIFDYSYNDQIWEINNLKVNWK